MKSSIPAWLLQREHPASHPGSWPTRRRPGFVRRTVAGLAAARSTLLSAGNAVARPGWLPKADPRVKVLGLLSMLVVAGLARHAETMLLLCAGCAAAASVSGISSFALLRRAWLPVLCAAAVFSPAALNWVRPGQPLAILWRFPRDIALGPLSLPAVLCLTWEGSRHVALLVLRVASSLAMAFLVSSTTGWPRLLQSLRSLGIPRPFVATLEMSQRYLVMLLRMAEDYYQALESRSVGPLSPSAHRRLTGNTAANLLLRVHHAGTLVHQAMVSRGYLGEPAAPPAPPWSGRTLVHLAAVTAVAGLLLGGDYWLGW